MCAHAYLGGREWPGKLPGKNTNISEEEAEKRLALGTTGDGDQARNKAMILERETRTESLWCGMGVGRSYN